MLINPLPLKELHQVRSRAFYQHRPIEIWWDDLTDDQLDLIDKVEIEEGERYDPDAQDTIWASIVDASGGAR